MENYLVLRTQYAPLTSSRCVPLAVYFIQWFGLNNGEVGDWIIRLPFRNGSYLFRPLCMCAVFYHFQYKIIGWRGCFNPWPVYNRPINFSNYTYADLIYTSFSIFKCRYELEFCLMILLICVFNEKPIIDENWTSLETELHQWPSKRNKSSCYWICVRNIKQTSIRTKVSLPNCNIPYVNRFIQITSVFYLSCCFTFDCLLAGFGLDSFKKLLSKGL